MNNETAKALGELKAAAEAKVVPGRVCYGNASGMVGGKLVTACAELVVGRTTLRRPAIRVSWKVSGKRVKFTDIESKLGE